MSNDLREVTEFVDEYHDLRPLCGGCGAKVSDNTLETVLSALTQIDKKDILTGIGDDAAIIRVGNVNQILTTDQLRVVASFSFPNLYKSLRV